MFEQHIPAFFEKYHTSINQVYPVIIMIRSCIICRQRKDAYNMLRIYADRDGILQFCALKAYKPSIRIASEFLCKDHKKEKNASAWICIKESCLSHICKKNKKINLGKKFNPKIQIFDLFAVELHRYMNHLHRQGGRKYFEKEEPPKDAHFVFIQTEDLSWRKNEISALNNTTNAFQYKVFFEEDTSKHMHNIALYDLSKKKKHKNRRQRISTILDIWAKLRYID